MFLLLTGMNRFLQTSRQLILLSLMPQCNEKLGGYTISHYTKYESVTECLTVMQFLCPLCLSLLFWVALLSLRQMKSNKVYMHLKLFQTEAYFCIPRSSSGREWNFLLTRGLILSGMWFNSSLSSALCKDCSWVFKRKRIISPNKFNEPDPPCLVLLQLPAGGGGCGKGFCCLSAGTAGARGCGSPAVAEAQAPCVTALSVLCQGRGGGSAWFPCVLHRLLSVSCLL